MITNAYAEIVKTEKQSDGTLKVWGKATGPDLDSDKQICDPVWLAKAMPEWFVHANVREQHSSIAAGVGTTLEQDGDSWNLESLVVDPTSVKKVETKVLKGYSIGISGAKVVKDAAAPGGRIVGGTIVEVSLVDRPANPSCVMTLAKAINGELTKVDEPVVEEAQDGDAEEQDWIAVAQDALSQWLVSEAAEVAAGTGSTFVVSLVLSVLQNLEWAAEADAYDDASAALEAVKTLLTTPKEDTVLTLSTVADLVKAAKADDATDDDKAAAAELRKALGIDDIESKINEATTEAETLKGAVTGLSVDMAKVNAAVINAGPTRVNTTPAVDPTIAITKSQVAKYRGLAATVTDREQSRAYTQLAQNLEATLTTL